MSALAAGKNFRLRGFEARRIFCREQFKNAFAGGCGLVNLVVQSRQRFYRRIHQDNGADKGEKIFRRTLCFERMQNIKYSAMPIAPKNSINCPGISLARMTRMTWPTKFAGGGSEIVRQHFFRDYKL